MSDPQHFGLFVQDAEGSYRPADDDHIIAVARAALDAKIKRQGQIASPQEARAFVSLRLGHLPYEVFAVIFLDAQHRIIEYREMFRGTLTQTSVYPREVLIVAMNLNAAAVILTHNHPSGCSQASRADEALTQSLKATLALVDVRVLDHLIVAAGQVLSMAETGQM